MCWLFRKIYSTVTWFISFVLQCVAVCCVTTVYFYCNTHPNEQRYKDLLSVTWFTAFRNDRFHCKCYNPTIHSIVWDPNSPVQIEIKPKLQFQFVPQDTEESEFLNLVDFGDVAFLVETVMRADFWEISTTYFNFAVWVCVDARFRVCLIFIRHFLQKSPILSGSCIPVTSTLLCVCV